MRYKILFFAICLYLPMLVIGQPNGFISRTSEIEKCTATTYTVTEFLRIVDSLHMSLEELCDYPIIFPIRKTQHISSGFGSRKHPIRRVQQFHTGIDIPQTKGTPVYATGNGVVTKKGYSSAYGYFIEVQHAGGFRSFYAHLNKTLVNIGDLVSITQQIACVGNTGVSTGYHLHYEVRKGNRYLNPTEWCCCMLEMKINSFG